VSIEARLFLRRGNFTLEVELRVPEHGVTAIFGPSGSGKTSLLRAMAGLEKGTRGRLCVNGDIWQDEESFLAPHRRAVGYVFQEASLFSHLSVRRNLEFGWKRLARYRRRIHWDQATHWLGVEPLLDRRTRDLSGGERQRVAIARALLTSPRMLLMDEPLASLDLEGRGEILPFLERLHRELQIPIFYVSHLPAEVARLADYLVILEKGRLRASGPLAETLCRLDLPLARGDEAQAVVECRVTRHDEDYDLTCLEFAAGELLVPRSERVTVGDCLRLRVLARDVSLTLEPQKGTSILNIIPVTVVELAQLGSAQVMVRLDAEGVPLLSQITRKSATALHLEPGRRLFAQVKSIAVLA
jgi:molybdate transport system ATP-binding protein